MLVETGHFALILALAMSLIQSVLPLVGAQRGDERLMGVAKPAAQLGAILLGFSFLALMNAFLVSDFSVRIVFENSHVAQPLLYKIAGVWGNHEGSILLWVLILAVFGGSVATFGSQLNPGLRARVLSIMGMIAFLFLLFILFASNPFDRLDPAPLTGTDLNPVLQDPALVLHPPFLYLGYVGFAVSFAFAIAALISGQIDAAWARWVRPWTLAAWLFLTIGIALGSFWAYYELGWGGWWFWDPVENASLMPWLAGTALLHSALVVEKRNTLKVWTIFLAILAFSLSLVGTFLVRSGVLTSVHAFALDPTRGVFILAILIIAIGGALSLFAWRARSFKGGSPFSPVSRETALILNNLILMVVCATVFSGTLYPLFVEAIGGGRISVGPSFFNQSVGPFLLLLLVFVPFGPLLAWKRGDIFGVMQRLWAAAALSLLVCLTVWAFMSDGPFLAPFGIALGVWVVVGAFTDIALKSKLFRLPFRTSWARAVGLPRSTYGTLLAHAGVGILLIGIVGATAWRVEDVSVLGVGEKRDVAGYTVTLTGLGRLDKDNYQSTVGTFQVVRNGKVVRDVHAERRYYWTVENLTSEVGLHQTLLGDLYIVLGEPRGDQSPPSFIVRIFYNPLISWIWAGALLMGAGGFVSLMDRRLRVGVPNRSRASRKTPKPEPLET